MFVDIYSVSPSVILRIKIGDNHWEIFMGTLIKFAFEEPLLIVAQIFEKYFQMLQKLFE